MIHDTVCNINNYKGSFAEKANQHMRFSKANQINPLHYDYTSYCLRKRIEGTVQGIGEAKKRLAGIMPSSNLDAYFIFSNSLIMRGGYYDSVDRFNNIALSAAIWILDELTLSGKIDELYQYLPSINDEQAISGNFCRFIHPMYDDSLINGLVYLIRHRNTSQESSQPENGSLLWENDKADPDDESQKLRVAFDAVIALLNPKSIKQASQNYEDKVWEFYKIAFSLMYAVETRENNLSKEISELQKSSLNALNTKPPRNVLLRSNDSSLPLANLFSSSGNNQIKIRLLENELDKLSDVTFTCVSLVNDRESLVKSIINIVPTDISKELIDFHVVDPFESAFALLYLMDSKSIVPWYYYGSISVAYTLCDQLPFDTLISAMTKPKRISEWDETLYKHRYKGYRFPNQENASGNLVERETAKNLSQLVFENTQSLIPRVAPEQINMTEYLEGFGELTNNEKEAYSLLSYILVSGQIRANSAKEYQAIQAITQEFEEQSSNTIPVIEEVHQSSAIESQLILENQHLRERNKQLIKLLGAVRAEQKESNKQCHTLSLNLDRTEKELSDLREIVFALENSIEQEVPAETVIQYPYHTKGKIVSFGGHQTWLKEIRKKLPDVIFMGPEQLPNVELLRNADEIWLQPNCMSHSAFYKIINTVRQAGIPLRYFTYAGVANCAQQLVNSNSLY